MSRRNSSRKKFDPAFVAAAKAGGGQAVLGAILAYAADLVARGKQDGFSKAAHTWLTEERWKSWLEAEASGSAGVEYDPWPMRHRRWREDHYWDRDWGPKPDTPGCSVLLPPRGGVMGDVLCFEGRPTLPPTNAEHLDALQDAMDTASLSLERLVAELDLEDRKLALQVVAGEAVRLYAEAAGAQEAVELARCFGRMGEQR